MEVKGFSWLRLKIQRKNKKKKLTHHHPLIMLSFESRNLPESSRRVMLPKVEARAGFLAIIVAIAA